MFGMKSIWSLSRTHDRMAFIASDSVTWVGVMFAGSGRFSRPLGWSGWLWLHKMWTAAWMFPSCYFESMAATKNTKLGMIFFPGTMSELIPLWHGPNSAFSLLKMDELKYKGQHAVAPARCLAYWDCCKYFAESQSKRAGKLTVPLYMFKEGAISLRMCNEIWRGNMGLKLGPTCSCILIDTWALHMRSGCWEDCGPHIMELAFAGVVWRSQKCEVRARATFVLWSTKRVYILSPKCSCLVAKQWLQTPLTLSVCSEGILNTRHMGWTGVRYLKNRMTRTLLSRSECILIEGHMGHTGVNTAPNIARQDRNKMTVCEKS